MAPDANGPEHVESDSRVEGFQRLSRRRIYYNRLIGDLGDQVRVQNTRSAPPHVVAVFLLYTLIATYVALMRCDIGIANTMNSAIVQGLEEVSFQNSPRSTYFADIDSSSLVDWLRECLLSEALGSKPTTNPLAILSFNRYVPSQGVCSNSAAVQLTARFAQQRARPEETSERFGVFYTEAWGRSTILPSDDASDFDQTSVIRKSYLYQGIEKEAVFEMVPSSVAGSDAFGNPVADVPLSSGSPIFSEWAFSPRGATGLDSNPGYIALITLGTIDANRTFSSRNQYVVLLDPTNGKSVNLSSIGLCREFKVSDVMLFDDFVAANFLGGNLASLSVDFTLYNANIQTLTLVQSIFTFDSTGFLSGKMNLIETIRIDIEPNSNFFEAALQWMDLLYAISTLIYFLELVFRTWFNWKKAVRDIWSYVTLASIITSLVSLISFFLYRQKMQAFAKTDDFTQTKKVKDLISDFAVFRRFSALAIFTIYWRLLQFLASVKARVRLLMQTLAVSAGNMAIYISFIIVIFYGFSTFAWNIFASQSLDFAGLGVTMISCFNMFMGRTGDFDVLPDSPWKNIFLLFFMIFFFFISTQMFNAIINYAYNRVSESMEPQFERERAEHKRKQIRMKLESKDESYWTRALKATLRILSRSKEVSDKDKDPSILNNSIIEVTDTPHFDSITDYAAKEKIEAFMAREKRRKAPEGLCSRILFLAFASSYFAFLYLNVDVYQNSQMHRALRLLIQDVSVLRPEGSVFTFSSIVDFGDMISWTTALPDILWGQAVSTGIYTGLSDEKTVCLSTFICILSGVSKGNSGMVRMTQRYVNVFSNTGGVYESNSSSSITRFIGGTDADGSVLSQLLADTRRPRSAVKMGTSPDYNVESKPTSLNTSYNGTQICAVRQVGEGGYNDQGGLVCILNSKREEFEEQLRVLQEAEFFNLAMGGLAIDFVTYNSNANVLAYVDLVFELETSGLISTKMDVSSSLLMDLAEFRKQPGSIIVRLLPGFIYVALIFYFIVAIFRDLASECYRKRVNQNMGTMAASIEFFTLDVFNALEAVSIIISTVSAIMYIAYLRDEAALTVKLQGSGEDLISYVNKVMMSASAYNRLSAVNMLIIFVRPLKFTRENARMAKLNQTLFDARIDIAWFVVMLFICLMAFVMLAHLSFGVHVDELADVGRAITYCFYYILGSFSYKKVSVADPIMAVIFFFPFLILFYSIFTSIFFAIIDRNFVIADPPPFNLKRALKPAFRRICRCIEWDEDYDMEEDPNVTREAGPPSRRFRVHETALRIEEIRNSAGDIVLSAGAKTSKLLNEVCDMDERMSDAMQWSKEEAKKFVDLFRSFLATKQDPKKMKNEADFIKDLLGKLQKDISEEKDQLDEAARHQRYAIQVHERMALRDQETLGKYIQLLEAKLKKLLVSSECLQKELLHLQLETDMMRFTEDEKLSKGQDHKPELLNTSQHTAHMLSLNDPQHSGSESGSSEHEGTPRATRMALEAGGKRPPAKSQEPFATLEDEQESNAPAKSLYEQLGTHLWED